MLSYSIEKATTGVVVFARPRPLAVDHRMVAPTSADNQTPVSGQQLWSHPPV